MNIEELRDFCLSLKGTQEDIKWGHDLCFTICSKMYCVTGADGKGGTSFKCTDENFELLQEREGIIPAPYMARHKWVMVEMSTALTKEEWKQYILQSYQLVVAKLPKKVKLEAGL
ncbi:MmcQ/YjbR family DNA-binding protein [Aridibaculum aurantiacum]|uniref:MmcQ/YjbR family DNA-binding protein n=1 Tax=Aridibaculum aurantiacum TaxID=2810307 RepID=UPI001A95E2EC|nr:MmcQ/YjbR family DNA-binding protein [Aridibaculum aurantiacum]